MSLIKLEKLSSTLNVLGGYFLTFKFFVFHHELFYLFMLFLPGFNLFMLNLFNLFKIYSKACSVYSMLFLHGFNLFHAFSAWIDMIIWLPSSFLVWMQWFVFFNSPGKNSTCSSSLKYVGGFTWVYQWIEKYIHLLYFLK